MGQSKSDAIVLSSPINPVVTRLESNASNELAQIDRECNTPPWSESMFLEEFNNQNSAIYGAKLEYDLVGFLVTNQVLDEAHILNVGVRRAFRGLGISRAILETVLAILRSKQLKAATLEVRRGNHVARALYRSFGFEEVGVRQRYYVDNHEDAIIKTLRF